LIFGGENSKALFNLRQIDIVKDKNAKVTPSRASFKQVTGFGQGSDSVIKIFNGKIMAVDAHNSGQYHVYDEALQTWVTKPIR
jgi:hypothetical protein